MKPASGDTMILEVKHLSKHFYLHQLERRVSAFDDLNFTLSRGEFLLVAGANGVGKSTLLRTLYRTYLASGGQALYHSLRGRLDLVRAADVDVALLRLEEIGFVTQFLRPRPRVTALELVAEPLLFAGTDQPRAQAQASAALEMFGLKPELWQAYPSTFSGGEQQKVNLAKALIQPRRLLLLDEPTASLDRLARAALKERLADLKNQGVAMIGVLHHPEDAAGLIEREIHLEPAVSREPEDARVLEPDDARVLEPEQTRSLEPEQTRSLEPEQTRSLEPEQAREVEYVA
jgi:alpha-D-ribose 1-methylphosphonate 5-triphosphate synthase subunit PhnL